jgi:hypothetical protein
MAARRNRREPNPLVTAGFTGGPSRSFQSSTSFPSSTCQLMFTRPLGWPSAPYFTALVASSWSAKVKDTTAWLPNTKMGPQRLIALRLSWKGEIAVSITSLTSAVGRFTCSFRRSLAAASARRSEPGGPDNRSSENLQSFPSRLSYSRRRARLTHFAGCETALRIWRSGALSRPRSTDL